MITPGLILHSEDSSPFSAPVRLAIYAKDLPIEIAPPPGGLRSTRYSAINPLGTIPCLMLDDGTPLPESGAIMEYLEDRFPMRPLRPASPEERARVRLMQRIAELQIMTTLVEIWQQTDPAFHNEQTVNMWLTRLVRGLSSMQIYLMEGTYAVGEQFSLADCALLPTLYMLPKVSGAFNKPDLLEAYPLLSTYCKRASAHAAAARVMAEMAPFWGEDSPDSAVESPAQIPGLATPLSPQS